MEVKLIHIKSELGTHLRGASLGPSALVAAALTKKSSYFNKYSPKDIEVDNAVLGRPTEFEQAKYIDAVYEAEVKVCETIHDALNEGGFPLVLSGDHSTAAGIISGIKKKYPDKRLGVIWIDAHADLNTPYTTPSGNLHGMPLAMVLNEDNRENSVNKLSDNLLSYWSKLKELGIKGPKINPKDTVFIGLRKMEDGERALIDKYKPPVITVEEVREQGAVATAKAALAHLSECDILFVSFDVDSMDPSVSLGTGTPVENGLTFEEAFELNKALVVDPRICCYEMTEINPLLDQKNSMAVCAVDILEAVTKGIEAGLNS